jgi:phosphoribosylformylglycinamidine synthase PurS subunit
MDISDRDDGAVWMESCSMTKKVVVDIALKEGILDPQGKTIHHALESLGFGSVKNVKVGKQIVLDVEENCLESDIRSMCETLLANTVIENFTIRFV